MNTPSPLAGERWQPLVLAPSASAVPDIMRRHTANCALHEEFVADLQRLRGGIYLQDGAIDERQLTADGRHKTEIDERAWHVLALGPKGQVFGCARYMAYPNTVSFADLGVSRSALAQSPEWRPSVAEAVKVEIAIARARRVDVVEVGGWALVDELRCTTAALKLALATYSLARILGGCIGMGTVTQRHCSSSILRRIGGSSLALDGAELPDYYDPQYKCQMELLRFESDKPNPKYEKWIAEMQAELLTVPVISPVSDIDRLRMAVEPTGAAVERPIPTEAKIGARIQ